MDCGWASSAGWRRPVLFSSYPHRRHHGQARTEQAVLVEVALVAVVEVDAHWHALHHLDEVAGGVLRRHQTKARAGGASYAGDRAVVLLPAERVHLDLDLLAGTHALQLGLLEVGRDPHVLDRHDG